MLAPKTRCFLFFLTFFYFFVLITLVLFFSSFIILIAFGVFFLFFFLFFVILSGMCTQVGIVWTEDQWKTTRKAFAHYDSAIDR